VQSIEYEGHIPGVDLVEALARSLGVSPGWLAYGMGEPGDVKELPGCAALGERLRTAREHAGLSGNALAKAAGTTHTTVQNIEASRNMPSVARVEALADALDLSPAWLAFGEGPQKVKRRRARPPSS
jgi:DNA-binding XRE family transcriptional regulator